MLGCGCLVLLLMAMGPRVYLLGVWLLTPRVHQAFDSIAIPVLGIIFLPWTTLIYVLVWEPSGVPEIGWLFVIFGFVFDVGSYLGSFRQRRTVYYA